MLSCPTPLAFLPALLSAREPALRAVRRSLPHRAGAWRPLLLCAVLLCGLALCLTLAGCGTKDADLGLSAPAAEREADAPRTKAVPASPKNAPLSTKQSSDVSHPDDTTSTQTPHGGTNDGAVGDAGDGATVAPTVTGGEGQAGASGPLVKYAVTFTGDAPEEAIKALQGVSILERLKDTPPDDMTGLMVRITADEAEAVRVLHAYGYYEGSVTRAVDTTASPVRVTLTLVPGPQFTMADGPITYVDAQGAPLSLCPPAAPVGERAGGKAPDGAASPVAFPAVPCTLGEAGLAPGKPAVAAQVLDAVDNIPALLRERGYPLARLASASYAAHKADKSLTAAVSVVPGPQARMGVVRMQGKSRVKAVYVERLRHWEVGRYWDQREVDAYRDMLTSLGLFRSVRVEYVPAGAAVAEGAAQDAASTREQLQATPGVAASAQAAALAPEQAAGAAQVVAARDTATGEPPLYDVVLHVVDGAQRSLGGGIRYDTDRGAGVQAYWEDRNFWGSGEHLRTEVGWWQDTQLARVSLRKPAFLDLKQTFTAEAWARNEDTQAYTQRAVWAGVGLERKIGRHVTASVGASVEVGDIKDPLTPRTDYHLYSLPVTLMFDNAGNPLDSWKGVRARVQVRPTVGRYRNDFFVYPTRLDVAGFYPLGEREDDRPRVVLAGRVAIGTTFYNKVHDLPVSLRWYGGGGGSVRGYAYQSLGPRRDKDPLGGASIVEVSGEARIAVWDAISVVPFIDGGNVYAEQMPDISADSLRWGAGLGLRYQTPIGPLRLDVATPLNPRKDDGPVSLYLSIGQSF